MLKFSPSARVAFAVLTLCLSAAAQAQWKWRDAAGKVQYSDRPPPPGVLDKDILQRPPGQQMQIVTVAPPGSAPQAPPAVSPGASGPTKAEQEQAAKQKQQELEQLARQKEAERKNAQVRRENCSRAQENMKMLNDGVRITRLNDRGERVFLDDSQRAAEARRTQETIASECR